MVKRLGFVLAILCFTCLAGTPLNAGQKKHMIVVVGTSSRQVNNHTSSYVEPGQSNTNCLGNADVNGTATDMGHGTTNINGTVDSNSSCHTAYTPPQTETTNWATVDNASWVTDVATGDEYLIRCTAHWRGSKCSYLTGGQYEANLKGNSMWITGMSGMKKETAKYTVLQYVPGARRGQNATTIGSAQNRSTPQLTADEATAWQIYTGLSAVNKAYVQDFCKQSPDADALVPQSSPTHVIQCKSWLAANDNSNLTQTKGTATAFVAPSSPVAAIPLADAAVAVSSTPSGADINLDGAFVGNTPSTITVAAGKHTITVTKAGYKFWERQVRVTGGKIDISAQLEPSQNN